MVTVRFPFVSKGFLVKHRLRRSSLRIAAYFLYYYLYARFWWKQGTADFLFYSIYFMFMHRELMFTVLEYMFTALEYMFIARKHNISRCKDTLSCRCNKPCSSLSSLILFPNNISIFFLYYQVTSPFELGVLHD